MESRESILRTIRDNLPCGTDSGLDVREDSVLADLGVKSLHLITMMMTLQRESVLDVDRVMALGMPVTVGDLVTLLEGDAR